MFRPALHTSTSETSRVSRGCGALFFSVFAIMGGFIAFMLGVSVLKDFATRSWVPTDAVLVGNAKVGTELERSSERPSKSDESVAFRYRYDGRDYTGDRVTLEGSMKVNGSSSATGSRLAQMPAGTNVKCYVNPANPSEAVLEQRSLSYAWFMLLPGVFLVVGLGGMYFSLFGKTPEQKPVSKRHGVANGKSTLIFLRVFGAGFILIGAAAGWFIAVKPALKMRAAQSWSAVPCKIEAASVKSSRGSKGSTTFSLYVNYTYEFGGRTYTGGRYNFETGSSSSRDWRDKAVAALRANPSPVCYVNPEDPLDAVLSRELGSDLWFGLIPLIFVVVGLAIFIGAPKMAATSSGPSGLPRSLPLQQPVAPLANGGYELKPATSPKASCIFMGIFALFWNGIVWAVFLQADAGIGVRLFLMIFVLVGLGLAGGFVYFFLALFNPKATVVVDAQSVPLGHSIKLNWRFAGDISRISHLALSLTAKESATYRRGTNTSTDHCVFVNTTLFETRDRGSIAAGEVLVSIPADSMHSFEAPNNKIVWSVKLHGDIAQWPDVDLDFPLTVLPQTQSQSAL